MNTTSDRPGAEPGEDPRLLRAAQEYLAELEAGRRPDRGAFVARFADVAAALAPYLDALDMVHGAAPVLHPSSGRRLADAALPAEPLGDFRIVGEVGRGGMGVVYEAVQMSLGRRVALKVLPFAAALDAKQLQRFRNEAQAAAQLHHTNIVPVYAVGCERGVHYYAMQLIEGQNLADLIAQMRPREPAAVRPRGAGADPEATGPPVLTAERAAAPATVVGAAAEMSTQRATRAAGFYRTAARLAAQAAEALEHAHQLGVIHRDVKPANLMVDARGNLWVTDFGLAQFHTGVGLTRTGDLLGTLRYMSPEQAGGQRLALDPRTDVYSLGATLYELLTLEPLFDGGDHHRLLRQILYDEPRPPRAADPAVPPELETIVLKAVGKNPSERYATAREFADDLQRFLDNRPILARRPTLVQRARKWGRRHPSVVAAAVVLCVLTAVGSWVSTWMISDASKRTVAALADAKQQAEAARVQAARADAALEDARQRKEEAEARFQLAVRAVDELIQAGEEDLLNRPDLQKLRKRMLETAVIVSQELIAQRRDDPKAQADLAERKAGLEKTLADLAVLEGAGRLFLLSSPDVLNDLHATEDQRKEIGELSGQMGEQLKGLLPKFGQLSPDERRQQLVGQAAAGNARLDEILTPRQRDRLRQIALQVQGSHAFSDPDVVAALKLTAAQKQGIRDIEARRFAPPPDGGRGGPHGRDGGRGGRGGWEGGFGGRGGSRGPGGDGPRGPWKDWQVASQSAVADIQALLLPDQARRWQEMTGEPFKGKVLAFGPLPGHFCPDLGPPGPPPADGPPPPR